MDDVARDEKYALDQGGGLTISQRYRPPPPDQVYVAPTEIAAASAEFAHLLEAMKVGLERVRAGDRGV